MKKNVIFNTWITSENVGDKIIMDSCMGVIEDIFFEDTYVEIPTHTSMDLKSYRLLEGATYEIVCGSNLLSNKISIIGIFNQWAIGLFDILFLKKIVLLGVGWKTYSDKESWLTKYFWRKLLNNGNIHSVRDEYTKTKLNNMGVTNVINTSCATMWGLTKEHCKKIPTKKSENVIFTLTDYRKDLLADKEFIKILIENYKKIYFWPQSYSDIEYIKELVPLDSINILPATLSAYDKTLENINNLDYVGTRLHGGIRALQKFKRAIILGVDNRAFEKEVYGLKVVDRNNLIKLKELINSEFEINIKLPLKEIEKWKKQFENKENIKSEELKILKIYNKIKKNLRGLK